MNVNEIIMNKRIERGISRKELAEGLGVSESTIYRIEMNPNLNPNNKLVKRILETFEIDEETARTDVEGFTGEFMQLGMIIES